jgi:two-component system OmpR family sensor kinase
VRARRPKPLHRRLTLVVAIILAAGLLLANGAVYLALRAYLQERLDATLSDTPIVFIDANGKGPASADHDNDPTTGPRTSPFLQQAGADGTVLRTQPGRDLSRQSFTVDLPADLPGIVRSEVTGRRAAYFDTRSHEPAGPRVRVQISTDTQGRILVIALPRTETDTTLSRLAWIQVGASIGVLLLVCAAAAMLVRRRIRPLRSLADAVEGLPLDELGVQVHVDTTTYEVQELATATNILLRRMHEALVKEQDAQERLRQFIADASHELRTPVAAVSAYAQLFELGAKNRPADLARSMAGIRHETARLRDLTDDLLTLASTEDAPPAEAETVDVAAVLGQAVEAALAVDRRRSITTAIGPGAGAVAADVAGLRRILDNLFANVRTHTPPGTHTHVDARRQDRDVVISVADDGPGLGAEERARMFDRFWREDSSRSRQAGGSGLGLSITATLAQRWNGHMTAAETPGGGLTVILTLPAHPGDEDAAPPPAQDC